MNHTEILQATYSKAKKLLQNNNLKNISESLSEEEITWLDEVIDKREYRKGILTVLITSITHKLYDPKQDIRYHQNDLKNGYSGRGVDTKYITPFMKKVNFPSMAESGWLTRSLEQKRPYTLDYKGSITPANLKKCFLNLLNEIEENNKNPELYLLYLFSNLIINRNKREQVKYNNFAKGKLTINNIISSFKQHLYAHYRYGEGISRLPTLAIHSVYQCMINEVSRYNGMKLLDLESHNASDRSTGAIGDIEVKCEEKETIFEGVEIKHGIKITKELVIDCYQKFKNKPVSRYYILSTVSFDNEKQEEIYREIEKIRYEHGCQIIVNGIFPSLKYYLRLINNPMDFISNYTNHLKRDGSLRLEHIQKWNEIIDSYMQ